jgi:hypothetical protein
MKDLILKANNFTLPSIWLIEIEAKFMIVMVSIEDSFSKHRLTRSMKLFVNFRLIPHEFLIVFS